MKNENANIAAPIQQPRRSRTFRIYRFLQTPLGTVFLSTIVAGIFSTGWSIGTSIYKSYRDKRELVSRLDKEIEYRILQLSEQYTRSSTFYNSSPQADTANHAYTWELWKKVVFKFKVIPQADRFQYLYPEFQRMSTVALMMQLSELVDDESQQKIKNATLSLASNQYLPPGVRSYKEQDILARQLRDNLSLPRWKKYFESIPK